MNSLIVSLIFTAFLYSSVQAQDCNVGNPCNVSGVFIPTRGYQCIQMGASVVCTCPGGVETNRPCRLCDRSDPAKSACSNQTGNLIMCLEGNFFGTSAYACLCNDGTPNGVLTADANCDTTVTLTTSSTTTLAPGSIVCANGGVLVNGNCHCPSGYTGTLCASKTDANLCDRIVCKAGVCAIRNINKPYEGVCLCPYGTWGEYCELTGTLGFCSANSCSNGGACQENVVGTTRHAYCRCPAGYNGVKCENRYFICPDVGQFADPTMFAQGKYFVCTMVGGAYRIEQRSCAKGLRYNANLIRCTY